MILKANYNKTESDYKLDGLSLRLNFNDIDNATAQKIIDKIIDFSYTNLHSDNCYYVSFDSKGNMRLPKKFEVSAEKVNPSYSVLGMILPDKKLRRSIMEEPLFDIFSHRPMVSESDLLEYLSKEPIRETESGNKEDFTITFNKESWDDVFSFECVIKVSRYSLEYSYDALVCLYNDLIRFFSTGHNLFSSYIDFCDMVNDTPLYEYCYDALLTDKERYENLRSFSWGGYITNELLKSKEDLFEDIKPFMNYEELSDGILYYNKIPLEQYDLKEQKKTYKTFRKYFTESYGIIPAEHLIQSGFQPCEDEIYLFRDIVCKNDIYVCFSNGIDLKEIIDEIDEFEYIKTLKTT